MLAQKEVQLHVAATNYMIIYHVPNWQVNTL